MTIVRLVTLWPPFSGSISGGGNLRWSSLIVAPKISGIIAIGI